MSTRKEMRPRRDTLKNKSGFGYDSILGTITADPDVWERYLVIKAHQAVKVFRYAGIANHSLPEVLFAGKVATGIFATSTADTSPSTISQADRINHEDLSDSEEESFDVERSKRKVATSAPAMNRKPKKPKEILTETMVSLVATLSAPKPLARALEDFNKNIGSHSGQCRYLSFLQ